MFIKSTKVIYCNLFQLRATSKWNFLASHFTFEIHGFEKLLAAGKLTDWRTMLFPAYDLPVKNEINDIESQHDHKLRGIRKL